MDDLVYITPKIRNLSEVILAKSSASDIFGAVSFSIIFVAQLMKYAGADPGIEIAGPTQKEFLTFKNPNASQVAEKIVYDNSPNVISFQDWLSQAQHNQNLEGRGLGDAARYWVEQFMQKTQETDATKAVERIFEITHRIAEIAGDQTTVTLSKDHRAPEQLDFTGFGPPQPYARYIGITARTERSIQKVMRKMNHNDFPEAMHRSLGLAGAFVNLAHITNGNAAATDAKALGVTVAAGSREEFIPVITSGAVNLTQFRRTASRNHGPYRWVFGFDQEHVHYIESLMPLMGETNLLTTVDRCFEIAEKLIDMAKDKWKLVIKGTQQHYAMYLSERGNPYSVFALPQVYLHFDRMSKKEHRRNTVRDFPAVLEDFPRDGFRPRFSRTKATNADAQPC